MKDFNLKSTLQQVLLTLYFIVLAQFTFGAEHVTYYVNDALGSPIMALDEAGAVVWQESYQPYGPRQIKSTASQADEQFYTGKQEEPDIGLQYYGARWYDPDTGRFTSIDPVGVDEGNIHSFNRYAYANNNPYKFVDPDGRAAEIILHKNGDVNINIPIRFSGPGATIANISTIKNDISAKWSGSYLINGKSTKVKVQVTSPQKNGITNNISLTNGPTSLKTCGGCSFVKGGSSGEWDNTSNGMQYGEAAHEAGHLMGAQDHYISTFNSSGLRTGTAPENGFSGNLMGQLPGSTNGNNMKEIMNEKNNSTTYAK